jgi:starch synthase
MNVLLASSEVYPFSKTGGLADMVGALGGALAQAGHEVHVVTPLYRGIGGKFPALRPVDWNFYLPLGVDFFRSQLWELDYAPRLKIYFIEQPEFFDRAGIYHEKNISYADNDARYLFFSKCVVNLARYSSWQPDIVHVHDWQTGIVPALILQEKRAGWGNAPRTCLTIHNLAYQGVFPEETFSLANLTPDFFTPAGAEFFEMVNFLKAGIAFADVVTTVSPRYAREITTEEYGCALDGFLRLHQNKLVGILNGVDYDEWNPQTDKHLFQNYSTARIAGKKICKAELQRHLALPVAEKIPLFGTISPRSKKCCAPTSSSACSAVARRNLKTATVTSRGGIPARSP